MENPDLTLIETKALVAELFHRFDYVVVITAQERNDPPGKDIDIGTAFSGGEISCLGLLSVMQAKLVASLDYD